MGPGSSARERLLPDRRGPVDGTMSDGSGTMPMRADEARKLKEAAEETKPSQRPQPHLSAAAGGRDTTATDDDVAGEADVTVGSGVHLV